MTSFSTRSTVVFTVLFVALVLATADLLVITASALLLIFAGLLFGVFVHALSRWPAKYLPLSYHASYMIVVTLMLFVIGMGFFYLGSQVAQRVDEFWTQLQSSIETADQHLKESEWAARYLPSGSELQDQLKQSSTSVVPKMLQGLQRVSWAFTGAIVIFFVGLYAAFDPGLYRNGIIKLVSKDKRSRIAEVLDRIRAALGLWLIGRFVSMVVVGIATAIGLAILGIPLPVSLGVLAALLTFIPNIGPLLATIPQMLLAVNVGANSVLYVIVLNLILQTVESYLITPIVQKHEVSLPPILTIAAQIVMGVVTGIIGVMMAAPLVVVIMVLVQMLYIHDKLGDEDPGELVEQC